MIFLCYSEIKGVVWQLALEITTHINCILERKSPIKIKFCRTSCNGIVGHIIVWDMRLNQNHGNRSMNMLRIWNERRYSWIASTKSCNVQESEDSCLSNMLLLKTRNKTETVSSSLWWTMLILRFSICRESGSPSKCIFFDRYLQYICSTVISAISKMHHYNLPL